MSTWVEITKGALNSHEIVEKVEFRSFIGHVLKFKDLTDINQFMELYSKESWGKGACFRVSGFVRNYMNIPKTLAEFNERNKRGDFVQFENFTHEYLTVFESISKNDIVDLCLMMSGGFTSCEKDMVSDLFVDFDWVSPLRSGDRELDIWVGNQLDDSDVFSSWIDRYQDALRSIYSCAPSEIFVKTMLNVGGVVKIAKIRG